MDETPFVVVIIPADPSPGIDAGHAVFQFGTEVLEKSLLRAQTKEFGLIDTDGRLCDQRHLQSRTFLGWERMHQHASESAEPRGWRNHFRGSAKGGANKKTGSGWLPAF